MLRNPKFLNSGEEEMGSFRNLGIQSLEFRVPSRVKCSKINEVNEILDLLRISLRKWRPGPKSGPKKGPKSGPKNPTPFGEPRCSETQGIQRASELFGLSEGSSFGLISGLILGSISGPPKSGTFQGLIGFNISFIHKMSFYKDGEV